MTTNKTSNKATGMVTSKATDNQPAISRRNFVKTAATAAALGITGAGSSLLNGCGSGTGGNGGTTGAPERVLRTHFDGEPGSLDTNYAFDGNSNTVVCATTAALFRLSVDGGVVPDLAESYTKSDDGLVYTFKLVDTTWTSGTPLTAHDFVYSWKRLINPDNGFGNAQQLSAAGVANAADIMEGLKDPDTLGVVALDDRTLEVTLDRPVTYVERIFRNTNLRPIEQTFFEAQGTSWGTSPETHNACGPYKLSVYTAGTPYIELVKNPDYHAASAIPFDKHSIQIIVDSQQSLLSYQNGDLDILLLSGDQVELFQDDPSFTSILRPQLFYIALNTIIPGFETTKLRKAFGLAIDKEYLVENILRNGSLAASYYVAWDFAYDSNGKDFREHAGTYQEVNRAEALRLWEEVKAEKGVDTLTFSVVLGEDDLSQRIGQYIQAQIQDTLPGIILELQPEPEKVWYDVLEQREWGLDIDWWWGEYPDAGAYLLLFDTKSPYNFSGYSNARFDKLIFDADTLPLAADEQGRIEAFVEAERIILDEDVALLPLYQSAQGYLVNPELNVEFSNGQFILETITVK